MTLYRFNCHGRQRGVIGIMHNFTAEVEAANFSAARLSLYDNWEHIRAISQWALQSDGHWMLLTPDGKRSIFDDVDE